MIKIAPREIEKLKSRYQELKRELAVLEAQLQAVALLSGEPEPKPSNGQHHGTMLDAIVELAGQGVKRKELKPRLQAMGFEGRSLGNYLYTAVKRLKAQKKIKVKPDGSLTTP